MSRTPKTERSKQQPNTLVIRVRQIKDQRSAATAANLEIIKKDRNLDILCLQEPFCYKGKVRGYNSPDLIKIQPQNCDKAWVAVVVINDKLEALETNVNT